MVYSRKCSGETVSATKLLELIRGMRMHASSKLPSVFD